MEERLKEKGRTLFTTVKKILDKSEGKEKVGNRQAIGNYGFSISEEGEKQISIEDHEENGKSSTIFIISEDGTVNTCLEQESPEPHENEEDEYCGQPIIEPVQITEKILDDLISYLENNTFT